MDYQSLIADGQLTLVAACAGSFVLGAILSRIVSGSAKSSKTVAQDPRDHQIRQLEADLRLTQRKLEDSTEQLENQTQEFDQSMATVHDLSSLLEQRNEEVEDLRKEVKGAVKKTHELRRELTDRAEETMREHVRAKEAETELDVVRAGSDALISEFNRVQEETDDKDAG